MLEGLGASGAPKVPSLPHGPEIQSTRLQIQDLPFTKHGGGAQGQGWGSCTPMGCSSPGIRGQGSDAALTRIVPQPVKKVAAMPLQRGGLRRGCPQVIENDARPVRQAEGRAGQD